MKYSLSETATFMEHLADAIESSRRQFDWSDAIDKIQSTLVRVRHVAGSRLVARIGFALSIRGSNLSRHVHGHQPAVPDSDLAQLRQLIREFRAKDGALASRSVRAVRVRMSRA